MARRFSPIVTNEIYHVFNRSIALQPLFKRSKDYNRLLETIDYYRFSKIPIRYSHFHRLRSEDKNSILKNLYKSDKRRVDIYAFSIMPNHYHLLIKQLEDGGISSFIRIVQESFAKYVNKKFERTGSLFQQMFKAVRIESDEQLLHVTRYIHLNPLTSYVIAKKEDLEKYPWTSFSDYLSSSPRPFVNTKLISKYFKERKDFKKFTLDQLDFQRSLQKIKHLVQE